MKAMYRAVIRTFERHRVPGGVVDIPEQLTLQKCHRCHEYLRERNVRWSPRDVEREKRRIVTRWRAKEREARERGEEEQLPPLVIPSDEELLAREKKDRDFRVCEHCTCSSEQTRKLRNRDFNAAIPIIQHLEHLDVGADGRDAPGIPVHATTAVFEEYHGTRWRREPFRSVRTSMYIYATAAFTPSRWRSSLAPTSDKTHEGAQFCRGLDGIAALLRYAVPCYDVEEEEKHGDDDDTPADDF